MYSEDDYNGRLKGTVSRNVSLDNKIKYLSDMGEKFPCLITDLHK